MKLIQHLTKENFFNELQINNPLSMDKFCNWIDQYKESVEWDLLFANNVKFHTIPFEMQVGIMNRFLNEHGVWEMDSLDENPDEIKRQIKALFRFMEFDLENADN